MKTKTTKQSDKILNKINTLFKKYTNAHSELSDMVGENIVQIQHKFNKQINFNNGILSRLNLLLKANPGKFRFDFHKGEYFRSVKDGKQVYHIEVSRTFKKGIEVFAESEDQAIKQATKILPEIIADNPDICDSVVSVCHDA